MMIVYAVIVLGVLIFVHEFGHFLVAKLFNVKVEKFSLGFGPKLVGKKIGETEYLVSAFPLGGYVKMFGEGGFIEGAESHHPASEEGEENGAAPAGEAVAVPRELTAEEKSRSFAHKPPLARIAIVMAGPAFNLVFAWLAFIVLCMLGVPSITTKIGEVLKDKPAAKAGVQKNDVITAINGKGIAHWEEVAEAIAATKGQPVVVAVKRNGADLQFTIVPEPRISKNLFGEKVNGFAIGVASAGEVVTEHFGPIEAIGKGTVQTGKVIEITVMSLVKLAQRVVPLDSLGGPIMIAKMAGETAQAGGSSFLAFMALLSVNLGVLNLLPVPVLDGGHLFFFFWELIFRRPVSQKAREYAQQVGLMLLLGLMILAFYNDIIRYFVGQG
ncbi:RIP metalloprotease RseP [Geobacter sp. FeAm09]|uniref:RIP metalloprotease RseP n=1 Tax=Geobacter sp. FeAm09 TaxID=2597769 RepID=UPI0011ECB809|nr:RIP metalloprotease RseP [Geobacter sp. FeAm09]QEM69082.1 RIP metalloprotease RseP [Geobacter sp. FeAm09]